MRDHRPRNRPALAADIARPGPLLPFMHGIGGNRSNWRDQLPAFVPHFSCVAWDARGYGSSDDDEGRSPSTTSSMTCRACSTTLASSVRIWSACQWAGASPCERRCCTQSASRP
jgi:pimeloyl-ACP methyl ester carboxylesterase